MPLGPFVVMSFTILMLYAVAFRGVQVLKVVAKERDAAKANAWAWQCRALEVEAEAQLAWHAYHGIGMGPGGWNPKDREAFKRLGDVLDKYNARGKVNP